jgi:hypothetical protein
MILSSPHLNPPPSLKLNSSDLDFLLPRHLADEEKGALFRDFEFRRNPMMESFSVNRLFVITIIGF